MNFLPVEKRRGILTPETNSWQKITFYISMVVWYPTYQSQIQAEHSFWDQISLSILIRVSSGFDRKTYQAVLQKKIPLVLRQFISTPWHFDRLVRYILRCPLAAPVEFLSSPTCWPYPLEPEGHSEPAGVLLVEQLSLCLETLWFHPEHTSPGIVSSPG